MLNKKQTPLSLDIILKCFICDEHEARHVCIIEWDGFNFKLCLCPQCVALNQQRSATELLQKVA